MLDRYVNDEFQAADKDFSSGVILVIYSEYSEAHVFLICQELTVFV